GVVGPEAWGRDPGKDQVVSGAPRGRKGRGVERGERALCLVESPDKKEPPNFEMPCMRRIHPVAVFFERRPRSVERLRRPPQVAGYEGNLGLGDDASCAGHSLFRTKGARGLLQEGLRPDQIAELRHRDTPEREGGRVIAQRDPVQRAERITHCECARRGRDQRVHRNPDTLVTPAFRCPALSPFPKRLDVRRNKMRNTKAKEIAMTTITSPEKDRKQL